MLAIFFVFVLVCAFFFAIGFSLGRKTTTAVNGLSMSPSAGTPASAVRLPRQKTTRTALPRQRRSPAILVFTRPWREKRRRPAYAARGEDSNENAAAPAADKTPKAATETRRQLLPPEATTCRWLRLPGRKMPTRS